MTMIPYYQVQAFTTSIHGGNPAGVCLLDDWLPDATLAAIARENDLSETAFLVGRHLRWFTPALEVVLCGHATLATAHALWHERGVKDDRLEFDTLSGRLTVTREGDRLVLDFPSRPAVPGAAPPGLLEALGVTQVRHVAKASEDWLVVLDDEAAVRDVVPDFPRLANADARGVIVTAPGGDVDFVSRFFGPRAGIDEDPVTGSAHTTLIPYWAGVFGRDVLTARQVSARGGELWCELRGERVNIAGQAVTYLAGALRV
jgi:PhzF family phenazine biosynthesis protein